MCFQRKVENYFIKSAKNNDFMHLKFVSPSFTGVPDRILIGHGLVIFVELKAPGEKPKKRQILVHNMMRKHGATVLVIDTIQGVDELFTSLVWQLKRAAGGGQATSDAKPDIERT